MSSHAQDDTLPPRRTPRKSALKAIESIHYLHEWENAPDDSEMVRAVAARIDAQLQREKRSHAPKNDPRIGSCIATFSDSDPDNEADVEAEDSGTESEADQNSEIWESGSSACNTSSDDSDSDLSFVVPDNSDAIEYDSQSYASSSSQSAVSTPDDSAEDSSQDSTEDSVEDTVECPAEGAAEDDPEMCDEMCGNNETDHTDMQAPTHISAMLSGSISVDEFDQDIV